MRAIAIAALYLMIGMGILAGIEKRTGIDRKTGEAVFIVLLWPSIVTGQAYLKWMPVKARQVENSKGVCI